MTKLIVAFRNFANAPKTQSQYEQSSAFVKSNQKAWADRLLTEQLCCASHPHLFRCSRSCDGSATSFEVSSPNSES